MKFSIERNALLDELVKCNKIVDPKSINPSTSGIFVEIETDQITLTATNSNMSIKTSIKEGKKSLNIMEVGSFLIKGKYIIETLRKMEDELIDLSNPEENMLFIGGTNNQLYLNLLSCETFPGIGFRENGIEILVESSDLKKAINQTLISVEEYNQKIVLSGLNMSINQGQLYISGTDRFRVSRKTISVSGDIDSSFSKNIPYKSCFELTRVLGEDGICKIVISDDSHILFSYDNTLFQSTILEGIYPDIKRVFPDDFNSSIFVKKSKIMKAISRADIRDDEGSATLINFQLEEDVLFIKSNTIQIGSYQEEFRDFELKGIGGLNIFFNSKFMLDALRTFDTDLVKINLIDGKKPIVINSPSDSSLSHIILPMNAN